MKNTVSRLRLLPLLLAAILATIAHALPSRPSGLHEDDSSSLVEDGLGVEQDFLPPAPSDALIEKMNMHNSAFDYQYAFWNLTNLDYNSCHKITQQLNRDIIETHGLCTFKYSCNFDSLRYPRWLIFTNCSSGYRCDPGRRSARCFSYEDDVLMLIYTKSDGRSISTRTTGANTAATTGTTERGDQVIQENGEWKLWFVQVPSDCKCSV